MTVELYQNMVIGSGEGGKILAWNLAKKSQKTIVVERSMIGGSCPNVACLPSKNVIYSAKAVSLVDPQHGLGVVTGSTTVDMAAVARRKRKMVEGLIEMHLANFKASGAELLMGEARFTEPKTFEVKLNAGGTRQLKGERVFLNLGSRASIPNVPGLADARPLTHVEALDLERLPEHLVVIGGGYVGLEFAQAMRRFGSRVTVVQRAKQLLDREDADVADALAELMRDEGIDVLLEADMIDVTGRSGSGVKIRLARESGSERSKPATSSWRPDAQPTPTASMSTKAACGSTRMGTFKSTNGCRRALPTFGPWATAPAVPSSRTSASTIFGSFWTT